MPINFTPEQQAVLDYKGDAFVLAVAGAGKSAVLVEKINLVKKENPGAKILYITFTRKARDEGKSRIHNKENVMIMNYHGLAYRIVEEHKGTLQYPEIDIVSDSYCMTILKGLYPTLKKDEHREMFKCINLHKCNQTAPKDMSPRDRSVYVQFNDIMNTQKKLTFSDLIPLANKVLEGKDLHPYMRSFLKYDHVFVDECVSGTSLLQTQRGRVTIKDVLVGDQVLSFDELSGHPVLRTVLKKWEKGKRAVYRVVIGGKEIIATGNHLFMTDKGWVDLKTIVESQDSYRIHTNNKTFLGVVVHGIISCWNLARGWKSFKDKGGKIPKAKNQPLRVSGRICASQT